MIRNLAFAGAVFFGGYLPSGCTPAPPPDLGTCEETISWSGRTPVHVERAPDYDPQALLDQGNAVNIGQEGYDHVAGHYSTHGAIFRKGKSLKTGDPVWYDCTPYVVTGRGSSHAGVVFEFQPGLTIQYSGCGGVCLVFAEPNEV